MPFFFLCLWMCFLCVPAQLPGKRTSPKNVPPPPKRDAAPEDLPHLPPHETVARIRGTKENFESLSRRAAGRIFFPKELLELRKFSDKDKFLLQHHPDLLHITTCGRWLLLPTPKYYSALNPGDMMKKGFVVGAWRIPPLLLQGTIFNDKRIRCEAMLKEVAVKVGIILWENTALRKNPFKRRSLLLETMQTVATHRQHTFKKEDGAHLEKVLNTVIPISGKSLLPTVLAIGQVHLHEETQKHLPTTQPPTPFLTTDLKNHDQESLRTLGNEANAYIIRHFGTPKTVWAHFHIIGDLALHCHFRVNTPPPTKGPGRVLWLDQLTGTQKIEDVQENEIPLGWHAWNEALDPQHRYWLMLNILKNTSSKKPQDTISYVDKNISLEEKTIKVADIPRVHYLSAKAQKKHIVCADKHNAGKLFWQASGKRVPVCTQGTKKDFEDFYAFIVRRDAQNHLRMYMHPYIYGKTHHVSTTCGAPVRFAGMANVGKDNTLQSIAVNSGHYHCGYPQLVWLLAFLEKEGVALHHVTVHTEGRYTGITRQEITDLAKRFHLKAIIP